MLTAATLSFFFYKKSVNREQEVLARATYNVVHTWELPRILSEASGIAWVNDSTFACIQDEEGVIYDFNLKNNEITRDVRFGENADYEAIAIKGDTAYVMRSDGRIFEVMNYRSDSISTSYFDTEFKSKNNMESLAYNTKRKALITVPKDEGLEKDRYKGLYSIPVATKIQDKNPLFNIDMKTKALDSIDKKKVENHFYPSDLAIHPKTGDYYLVDGKNLKLLILRSDGSVKKLHDLNRYHFEQPEGIAFSPDGKLFIANEASGGVATLLEITLED